MTYVVVTREADYPGASKPTVPTLAATAPSSYPMRNRIVVVAALLPLIFVSSIAEAGNKYEVRRLKNGTCDVREVRPGPEAGDRIAGPFESKSKAEKKTT